MNEDRYQLFDQYLNNELTIDQKTNFENELKSNDEFQESFAIYQDMNGFLTSKFQNQETLNSFKENLKNAAYANDEKVKTSKIITLKRVCFAIAACFSLAFGLMVFNNSGAPTYQDYDQHEEAHFTERGDVIKNIKQAQEAFNAKNYAVAVPLFESILKSYPRPEIEYFYGLSLLETNKYFEAEMIFNKLRSGQSIYKTKAVWSLALVKLKQKDLESCKTILKTIPEDFEDYEQVESLLKKLE